MAKPLIAENVTINAIEHGHYSLVNYSGDGSFDESWLRALPDADGPPGIEPIKPKSAARFRRVYIADRPNSPHNMLAERYPLLALEKAAEYYKKYGKKAEKAVCQLQERVLESAAAPVDWLRDVQIRFLMLQIELLRQKLLGNGVHLGHLDYITQTYVRYYNTQRSHQNLGNVPLRRYDPPGQPPPESVGRQQLLGGLLNHYYRKAA